MSDDQVIVLLRLLNIDEAMSVARVAKKMQLTFSELMRMLAALGSDEILGGPGWVEVLEMNPPQVRLTQAGRDWIGTNAPHE